MAGDCPCVHFGCARRGAKQEARWTERFQNRTCRVRPRRRKRGRKRPEEADRTPGEAAGPTVKVTVAFQATEPIGAAAARHGTGDRECHFRDEAGEIA
jgi:hypothetical protein